MQQNESVINQWSQSAPYWEKHRELIREMFAPVTQALIDDAEITEGLTVLDVATGPGEPALTIAGLIGPRGNLAGTDAVAEMLDAARRESRRRELRNARFETAFAENLPFPNETFDVVVCRFGVMFFPSPEDAIREWLRVLKPGGKIALAVWHFAENNPFHYVLSKVVDRYVGASPPPAPDSPDAFRFAQPGKLKSLLLNAGVVAPSERLLQFPIAARMPIEDFWTLRYEMSEKLRSRTAALSSQAMLDLKREAIEAARKYVSDGKIIFPGEVLILSGGKPNS